MIEQIKTFVTRKKEIKKEEEKAPYIWGNSQNITVKTDNKRAALKHWSGICINRIAENVANTKFFFEKDGKEVETQFNFLFEKANISYVPTELIVLIAKSLEYSGNSFIRFPKFNTNVLSQWWYLPTARVHFQINTMGQYSVFELTTDKGLELIPPDEICHIKTMDVVNDATLFNYYSGEPRVLNTIIDNVFTEEEKANYLKRYFARDGIDPMAILSANPIGKIQADEFKDRLNAVLPKGYVVAAILDDKKTITSLPSGGLLNSDVSKDVREEICAAYGVPLAFLTGEYQNRATSQVVRETVFTTVIEPRVNSICQYLTNYFRTQGLPDDVKLSYESGKFYDEELFTRTVEFGVQNGFIGDVEYRELLGLPEAKYDTTTEQITNEADQNITENNGVGEETGTI